MKEISSLQHPLVKQAVRLRQERKEREKERLVLVSGKKMVSELASFYPIHTLFFTKMPSNTVRADEVFRITSEVLKKISGVEEKEGCAAIVPLPPPQPLEDKSYLLILDRIGDPGNLGTLFRTALAFEWGGVWLTEGTVDPFNDKALRAAKGATFRLPYDFLDPAKAKSWLKQRNATIFAADLDGEKLSPCCCFEPPLALLLGSEGQGPGDWVASLAKKITIPMKREVESLNVASAGSILLFSMKALCRA